MFVGHFCPPGSGSGLQSGSGYGSRSPIESGANPDPNKDLDPQHWIKHESRSQYAPRTAGNVGFREVIEPALFLGRIRYLGDGVVHPVGVVDPGQVGLVQSLSQHLADECTWQITVSCRRHICTQKVVTQIQEEGTGTLLDLS
jgi:hypothetical protein